MSQKSETIPVDANNDKNSFSRKSSDSSDDYVVVVGDGDTNKSLTSPVLEYVVSATDLEDAIAVHPSQTASSPSSPSVVGKSIFYDCPLNENLSFHKSDTDEGLNSKWNSVICLKIIHCSFQTLRRTKSIKTMETSQFSRTSYI